MFWIGYSAADSLPRRTASRGKLSLQEVTDVQDERNQPSPSGGSVTGRW